MPFTEIAIGSSRQSIPKTRPESSRPTIPSRPHQDSMRFAGFFTTSTKSRKKVDNFNRKLLVLLLSIALLTIPTSQALAQSKHHHHKVYCKKHHRYEWRNCHKNHKRKHVIVSRGAPRSYWPVIEKVGSLYWKDPAELKALHWIQQHECNTPGIINQYGCKGLFQLKNPPKWMILGDAASETRAGCEYVKRRYGSPLKAKSFWLRKGWY